jgi:hypothetical protein
VTDNSPQWNVPGWNWDSGDTSWLSSNSGIYKDGVSVFFIAGGRIRHQADIPEGYHTVDEFFALVQERAVGLDDPRVVWTDDTGNGDPGLWVEGTREPNEEDLARLQAARDHQRLQDEITARGLRKRRPDLFKSRE